MSTISTTTTHTVAALTTNRTYVATRSPDEVYKAIIDKLGPHNSLDAAGQEHIRCILNEVIVPPQLPPGAIPRRATGSLVRHWDLPPPKSSSSYKTSVGAHVAGGSETIQDGPPIDINKSFYFPHTHESFPKLLPQVDRSRYEKARKPKNAVEKRKDKFRISKHSAAQKKRVPSPLSQCQSAKLETVVEEELEHKVARKTITDAVAREPVTNADARESITDAVSKAQDQTPAVTQIDLTNGDVPSGRTDRIIDVDVVAAPTKQQLSHPTIADDDVGFQELDAAMSDSEVPDEIKVDADISDDNNKHSSPPDLRNLSASQDFLTALYEESPFLQSGPSSQAADSAYGTQPTDSQVQDPANFKTPRLPRRRKPAPTKIRRSLRLSKADPASSSVPVPDLEISSAPEPSSASLGKRSCGSKETETEPMRKKLKR